MRLTGPFILLAFLLLPSATVSAQSLLGPVPRITSLGPVPTLDDLQGNREEFFGPVPKFPYANDDSGLGGRGSSGTRTNGGSRVSGTTGSRTQGGESSVRGSSRGDVRRGSSEQGSLFYASKRAKSPTVVGSWNWDSLTAENQRQSGQSTSDLCGCLPGL